MGRGEDSQRQIARAGGVIVVTGRPGSPDGQFGCGRERRQTRRQDSAVDHASGFRRRGHDLGVLDRHGRRDRRSPDLGLSALDESRHRGGPEHKPERDLFAARKPDSCEHPAKPAARGACSVDRFVQAWPRCQRGRGDVQRERRRLGGRHTDTTLQDGPAVFGKTAAGGLLAQPADVHPANRHLGRNAVTCGSERGHRAQCDHSGADHDGSAATLDPSAIVAARPQGVGVARCLRQGSGIVVTRHSSGSGISSHWISQSPGGRGVAYTSPPSAPPQTFRWCPAALRLGRIDRRSRTTFRRASCVLACASRHRSGRRLRRAPPDPGFVWYLAND